MARMAILLAALALSACADLALTLPSHETARLMRGCEARPPVAECSPTRGAIVIRFKGKF